MKPLTFWAVIHGTSDIHAVQIHMIFLYKSLWLFLLCFPVICKNVECTPYLIFFLFITFRKSVTFQAQISSSSGTEVSICFASVFV